MTLLEHSGCRARRHRRLRRRDGTGLVHRPAHRHRDDAGAGVCGREAVDRRVGARCAGARRRNATAAGRPIATWVDAWRGEVYRGALRERTSRSTAPVVSQPEVLLDSTARIGRRCSSATARARISRHDSSARLASAARIARDRRRRCWPARSRRSPATSSSTGAYAPPHAIRPLYVRRTDAELATRCASTPDSSPSITGSSRLDGDEDLDGVLAVEVGVVHESVDEGDVRVGAAEPLCLPHLRRPHARAAASSASVRSGWSSMRSTSTTSRFVPALPRAGHRHGADAARVRRSAAAGCAPRHARGSRVERGGAAAVRTARVLRRGNAARTTTRTRSKMRSSCGAMSRRPTAIDDIELRRSRSIAD